jgi:hypothetical protein
VVAGEAMLSTSPNIYFYISHCTTDINILFQKLKSILHMNDVLHSVYCVLKGYAKDSKEEVIYKG